MFSGNFGCFGASRTSQEEEVLFTVIYSGLGILDWRILKSYSGLNYANYTVEIFKHAMNNKTSIF